MKTKEVIISNRKLLDNDTSEFVDKYIDEVCSDPDFLCKNRQLCGTSTTLYTSIENVNKVCKDIKLANKCENDIQECIVQVKNKFDESQKFISTSFVNIIIPIPNAFDEFGNIKFLRLPPLSGSKKKNSKEICNVCACMDRFARSPGAGANSYTSPGQNECVYPDDFEYFYYPLYIENINNKLKTAPPLKVGKYTIVNKNIIYANSQEDLNVKNLFDILIKNGITEYNTSNFITNVLYKNNNDILKELQLYLLDRSQKKIINTKKINNYSNTTSYYIMLIAFIVFVMFILLRNK